MKPKLLCKLLQNHAKFPYSKKKIINILFESGKTLITSNDIPPINLKKIEIASRILSQIKQETSFSSEDLAAHFWQVLNYKKMR